MLGGIDPSNDPCNALRYIPSNTLTAITLELVLTVAFIQTYLMFRHGGKWMLTMVIGEFTYALGFGFRFGVHDYPDSLTIYIVEYLFIILSPCAFIAANYILLGRLSRSVGCEAHVLVPVRRLTLIFILSDVTTFVIQAAGGGLTVSNDYNTALTGAHIFLAGLVLQLVSFLSFSAITVRFLLRVRTHVPLAWNRDSKKGWHDDWRILAGALCISCVGILVRSGYRVAELSQTFHGSLSSTESYFYGLDTLPLFTAIAIYVPLWPGRFITADKDRDLALNPVRNTST
ncbi:hypothetical protein PAXRUDRAFT_822648 [Paxillus rubicundulus Ve08.2h10]|uniref:RTA1-like protein n=1 Tax=Paxillus rubicundulus Ve08.2h10 TaxID=930991 RepID=A0A0D0DWA6_9AGAM|nr:hypothetical protein PAXRUDRAFT_822648 [Paxillus rubicundulus Ve08.2h10]